MRLFGPSGWALIPAECRRRQETSWTSSQSSQVKHLEAADDIWYHWHWAFVSFGNKKTLDFCWFPCSHNLPNTCRCWISGVFVSYVVWFNKLLTFAQVNMMCWKWSTLLPSSTLGSVTYSDNRSHVNGPKPHQRLFHFDLKPLSCRHRVS